MPMKNTSHTGEWAYSRIKFGTGYLTIKINYNHMKQNFPPALFRAVWLRSPDKHQASMEDWVGIIFENPFG